MYLGDLGLGDKKIAFSLMRQVATIFGSGSIQDFTTKVPNAVRPPQRLSLELQLLR